MGVYLPCRVRAFKCGAAVPAASVGGVSPPDLDPIDTRTVPGTGTAPELAGENACATVAIRELSRIFQVK